VYKARMSETLTRWRAALSRHLPPGVRRAGAGLLLDLQSLPARLSDPARRGDPWQTWHNVGAGDFHAVGDNLLDTLVKHAGLEPHHRVLDIGCGSGRVARPLAGYLSRDGGYVGFDVSRRAVVGCQRRFVSLRPDFTFVHADVRNADYNPRGAVDETAYAFPCADSAIDLAFATSVFTHMRMGAVRRYLAEAARVLKRGGRLAFTAFLIDEAARRALAAGGAGMAFAAWRDGSWVTDAGHPERAIAHDAGALAEAVAAAGLRTAGPPLRGAWCPPAAYAGWQDLWLADKR
jgi:SAM-dependent methyltransferase